MNLSEAATLLGLAAARDRRTVGEADAMAWAQDLDGITFEDAREAIGRHFRESTDWLMPAHIRALVKVIRSERSRGGSAPLALPSRFESDDERRERIRSGVAACRAAIAPRTTQPEGETPQ